MSVAAPKFGACTGAAYRDAHLESCRQFAEQLRLNRPGALIPLPSGVDLHTLRSRIVLAAPTPAPGKCGGCGSSDYVQHQGRHVCAYCRAAP